MDYTLVCGSQSREVWTEAMQLRMLLVEDKLEITHNLNEVNLPFVFTQLKKIVSPKSEKPRLLLV